MRLDQQPDHLDQTFNEISHAEEVLEEIAFQDCRFDRCDFRQTVFRRCRFRDCTFEHCDLSCARVADTFFADVRFSDSKLMGVNWGEASWPKVRADCPVGFERCILTHATFLGLKLPGLKAHECLCRGTDFREGDFSGGDFAGSVFSQALFGSTDLRRADFSRATEYVINPLENRLEKARFSLPEAVDLLLAMRLKLDR